MNIKNLCYGCMNEKVGDGKCPICGYQPEQQSDPSYLAPGYVLEDRYIIGKVSDANGEGVTYLGFDTVSEIPVNVREYFPSGLCKRAKNGEVAVIAGKESEYNSGIISFLDLSKTLFRLNDLPSLFKVFDVREANNAAYRISQSVPCISLREFLLRNGGALKWDQARPLFVPLISTLAALHQEGVVHMGISPDTIMVGKDAKLRLSGFCIAETRTAKSIMTSQIFPGFAAIEQYGMVGRTGPWTDAYGYAATLYRTIVGNPPPEAIDRMNDDHMTIPARIAKELPHSVLETIADALQILPDDRTKDISSMRKGLAVASVVNTMTDDDSYVAPPVAKAGNNGKKKKMKFNKYSIIAAGLTLAVILALVLTLILEINSNRNNDNNSSHTLSTQSFVISTASKTDYDNTKYYIVPNFVGMDYATIYANTEYAGIFEYLIKNKEYSDSIPRGSIITQSLAEGCEVEKGTKIEFVVSLGKYEVKLPDVRNLELKDAKIALYEAGFTNIEVGEILDENKPFGTIVETEPAANSAVNLDLKIKIYVNTYEVLPDDPIYDDSYYEDDEESSETSSNTSSDKDTSSNVSSSSSEKTSSSNSSTTSE